MNYVMADVHGHYDKYLNFLHYVHFGDEDTLYIIGDLINRGSYGILLLQDVMKRKNVITIMGNHEHMLLPTFKELTNIDKSSQCKLITNEVIMMPIGQRDTLNDFCQLSKEDQLTMIDYIRSMPLFAKVTVTRKNIY